MKNAFIITSSIEVDNNFPLTYSTTRSFFSSEERLRQTIMTIASLDLASKRDTTFFLLDTSNNYQEYERLLRYQPNLRFISIKENFPEIFEIVTTHPHKSVCESMLMSSFLRKFKPLLRGYDYIFKMTGRYFVDGLFDTSIFNEKNKDKIFFKRPLEFTWKDEWQYHMVDYRKEQETNTLRQYCTVLYGWGQSYYDQFLDIFTALPYIVTQPNMGHLDVETLIYYFTRPFQDDVIETNWLIYGWDGASGKFWRY